MNANSHGWFESWIQGREHDQGLQKQQTEESLVHFEEDDKTRLEQAVTLLSAGNLVRSAAGKLKQLHFGCMNVGQMKAWLGVELFSSFSRGCREKRKEKVRLREAQVHAALSVTRLAAAIAGFSANSRLEPTNAKCTSVTGMGGGALDEKMNAVVASAAALVATVCAEAAESVGANRERVASAIGTGLAAKTSADMVSLTATCNAPFTTSFTDESRSLV
ncbi:Plant pleckstrin region [Musa troglodytarum]|uniref:Plant pleckstrin region n=1 Tax=Musa troglodytarum TaxID=320322 RepID=A0A9E7FVP8_9LILI|nr:Plant pleckstrin region [Musa troglodytarum]